MTGSLTYRHLKKFAKRFYISVSMFFEKCYANTACFLFFLIVYHNHHLRFKSGGEEMVASNYISIDSSQKGTYIGKEKIAFKFLLLFKTSIIEFPALYVEGGVRFSQLVFFTLKRKFQTFSNGTCWRSFWKVQIKSFAFCSRFFFILAISWGGTFLVFFFFGGS